MNSDETDFSSINRSPENPKVKNLRDYLDANNGIKGLEILVPDEIDRAVKIFYRDGFVVIRDALDTERLDFMRKGCDRVIREMLKLDPDRIGNRGSHRYSFGGASRTGHLMHQPEWAMLLDLETVTPILTAIFGSSKYIARGGGGDFCLPGAVEYQSLHSDMGERFSAFADPRGVLSYRDLPCPYICCNYLMVDFTRTNGAIRQIPGTQHSLQPIPLFEEEPEWMKLSTVCPAPAGSVLIRDVRAWHGGTPNVSDEGRAIPNAEFFAPWYREPARKCVPRVIFDQLSDHGQRVCEQIVADSEEELDAGVRQDFVVPNTDHNKLSEFLMQ